MSSGKTTSEVGVPSAAHRAEGPAMDHPFIDDHQVIERFVLGRLSDSELSAFEQHFLGCPACLDQLEAVERLHSGVKGVAAEEVAARLGLLSLLHRSRPSWLTGALVALLALLPAGLLWRSNERITRELAMASAPRAGVALLHLSPARAAEPVPDVHLDLATAPPWIVLALDLADAAPGPYQAELVGPAGELLWLGAGLTTDRGGIVAVALPPSLFAIGDHRLTLRPENGVSNGSSFHVRTTRSPRPKIVGPG
jgi:hypothetical protein